MLPWKVYITGDLPEEAARTLEKECALEINNLGRGLRKEELIEAIKDKDGVLCLLSDKIDDEVMQAAKKVKVFANYAVGYDNIDLVAAKKYNKVITNTPGVLTDATADLAWALLFAVARQVVVADKFTRDGLFEGWKPLLYLGQDITGKTLGIIGGGRIGSAFGRKAKGFDMNILYNSRRPNEEFEEETGGCFVDKDTLLKEADFISLHVPLLPATKHLIGEREFKMMKKTAILINTARGPVVDEAALVDALKAKEIFGAGLDVYEEEPKLHPGLFALDNVVILPHVGSGTFATRGKMATMAAENILAVLRGEMPPNRVV